MHLASESVPRPEFAQVRKREHVKPGKGGAYVQLELQSLRGDTKTNQRVRSTETLSTVEYD